MLTVTEKIFHGIIFRIRSVNSALLLAKLIQKYWFVISASSWLSDGFPKMDVLSHCLSSSGFILWLVMRSETSQSCCLTWLHAMDWSFGEEVGLFVVWRNPLVCIHKEIWIRLRSPTHSYVWISLNVKSFKPHLSWLEMPWEVSPIFTTKLL